MIKYALTMGHLAAKLENQHQPLLGPNVWGLKVTALLGKSTSIPLLMIQLVYTACQLLKLWQVKGNWVLATENMSTTCIGMLSLLKIVMFRIQQRKWNAVIEAVSKLQTVQMSIMDENNKRTIRKYTKYSRLITYSFWSLVTITMGLFVLTPLANYTFSAEYREEIRKGIFERPQIFSVWSPFDDSKSVQYVLALLWQCFGFYNGFVHAAHDTFIATLFIFFGGQFEILNQECCSIVNEDEAHDTFQQRLVACYKHHLFLIKYAKKVDDMNSPLMFVYFFVWSVILCMIAFQLTTGGKSSKLELFWMLQYIGAILTESFLFYWHANEVYYQSCAAGHGALGSSWGALAPRGRRQLVLLAAGLQQPVLFTAGPFSYMQIPTFLAIVKASYSYFMLLRRVND